MLFKPHTDRVNIIRALLRDALPKNWHDFEEDDPEQFEAWRNAMTAVGIDPETMKESDDG